MNRSWFLKSVLLADLFAVSGVGAFLLRFEFVVPPHYVRDLWTAILIWVLVKSLVFHFTGFPRSLWRFISTTDIVRLGVANALGFVVSFELIALFCSRGFPRSIPIIDLILCSGLTAVVFVGRRAVTEGVVNRAANPTARRVVIYGAGAAGVMLMREIRANPNLGYRVVGMIDDDPRLGGLDIQGTRVLGSGPDLAVIARNLAIEEVLVAIPSARADQMVRVLEFCNISGLRCRTVPALAEIVRHQHLSIQIRDVDVQDLLCRAPARLDRKQIRERVEGRVVLVTGAAGSIGSELCRQIARFEPAAIVAFEIAETALFHLEREMRHHFPGVLFHPEIGNVQNARRVAEVMNRYHPSVVYHAAAYKHVPMMESSLFEAIDNNILGTWTVAQAARDHGVDDFILISSDKAVRPSSVMGATKRFCELMVLAQKGHETRYVAVRFGNVLGSNGSVIPLFKTQIATGGPVTVTHPEMRRYFMTTSEAAQLVLEASAMGHSGEIFVLDMGEPLKIVDVARNLILLSGLRPDRDIKIEFTGLRQGEKLFEELNFTGEEMLPTHNDKIRIFAGNGLPKGDMSAHVQRLRELCENREARGVILFLKTMIPEYTPSTQALWHSRVDSPWGEILERSRRAWDRAAAKAAST